MNVDNMDVEETPNPLIQTTQGGLQEWHWYTIDTTIDATIEYHQRLERKAIYVGNTKPQGRYDFILIFVLITQIELSVFLFLVI